MRNNPFAAPKPGAVPRPVRNYTPLFYSINPTCSQLPTPTRETPWANQMKEIS